MTHLASNALKTFTKGKVRDVYDLDDRLLVCTSDRISAYDVVLPDPIPDKGKVLTAISLFWFDYLGHICPHHLISGNVDEFPAELREVAESMRDRAMLETMYSAGLRVAELVSLDLESWDRDANILRVIGRQEDQATAWIKWPGPPATWGCF